MPPHVLGGQYRNSTEERTIMNVVYAETDELLNDCYFSILGVTRVALDIETTGLDPYTGHVLLIQIYAGGSEPVFVIPAQRVDQRHLSKILHLLAEKILLIHSASFEGKWFRVHYGIKLEKVYDSKVCEAILTCGLPKLRTGLADTAERHLGIMLDKEVRMSFVGQDPKDFVPTAEQIRYAALDVAYLFQIREAQLKKARKEDLLRVVELEMAAVPIFTSLELKGMRLNIEAHKKVIEEYQEIFERAGKEAFEVLNPFWKKAEAKQLAVAEEEYAAVTAQINKYLSTVGGRLSKDTPEDIRLEVETLRRIRKKPKAAHDLVLTSRQQVMAALEESGTQLPDLTADTVKKYAEDMPVLSAYHEWAIAGKILSTYGQGMVEKINSVTGRLSSEFNQIVSTGRVSSSHINLQNIPPVIRKCFVPEQGYKLVIADVKNQELRVAACLSGDQRMLRAFKDGDDLHSITASVAWPELFKDWTEVPKESEYRKAAKVGNFTVLYGGSAHTLLARGVVKDIETADKIIAAINKAYPTLMRWMKQEGERALRRGYALTVLGRRRYCEPLPAKPILPPEPTKEEEEELQEWFRRRSKTLRELSNTGIQGSSSDQLKRAMVLIDKELKDNEAIIVVVHDEVCTEVPEPRAEEVKAIMQRCIIQAGKDIGIQELELPADAVIADRWEK